MEQEGNWSWSLGLHDTELLVNSESPKWPAHSGLFKSLKTLGYSHVLDLCLQGLLKENPTLRPEIRELQYESAWRNLRWDMEPEVCMTPFTLG